MWLRLHKMDKLGVRVEGFGFKAWILNLGSLSMEA